MTSWARLCAVLVIALFTARGYGQFQGYFNPIVTRASNSQPDNGTFAFLGVGNTSALRGGVSIGSSYMFQGGPGVRFGIDVRDEWQGGSNALLNSFLIGARAAGHLGERWKPYAQLSGGVGTTRAPFTRVRTSKAMAKVYGGLDFTINRHLDFRAVEVGFGTLTTASSAQYNSTLSYPSSKLLSFSSGLVVNFGK